MSVCRCATSYLDLHDKIDDAKEIIKLKPSPPEASLFIGSIRDGLHNVAMACDVSFVDEPGRISNIREQIYEKDWDKALKNLRRVETEIRVKIAECSLAE